MYCKETDEKLKAYYDFLELNKLEDCDKNWDLFLEQ